MSYQSIETYGVIGDMHTVALVGMHGSIDWLCFPHFDLAPSDPRMLQTLDAINHVPAEGGLVANSLVYRYDAEKGRDGLMGSEGTFNICTFWLVEALTRAGTSNRAAGRSPADLRAHAELRQSSRAVR